MKMTMMKKKKKNQKRKRKLSQMSFLKKIIYLNKKKIYLKD